MDGRVKPVKTKPKKRPRPVNPRYQPPAAPVSAAGPTVKPVKPQVAEVPQEYLASTLTKEPQDYLAQKLTVEPQEYLASTLTKEPQGQDYLAQKLTVEPLPGTSAARPQNPFLSVRQPTTPPQPTETEAALGMTPQNPFQMKATGGAPTVTADGRVPRSPFPMPVNPMSAPKVAPAATVAAPLSRREQLKQEIAERQNRKFENKRGIKNTLKAAGIGFLQAFAQNAGLPLNERIMASLGGAAAGGVAGTVNPNLGSQLINKQKLADLYGQYGQATEMEEADAKAEKAQIDAQRAVLDLQGTGIENINKRVKDYLLTASVDHNIDEMEAKTLREMTGLPYSANDWRKVVRFDDQGVPFIAREGEEAARIDPSRPINPAEQVKPRVIEGQTYNVPDKTAFGTAGQVAVGNANRQQSASQYQQTQETTAANREFEDEKDYTKSAEDHRRRVIKAKADSKSAQARLTAAEKQLATLQESRASIAAQGYDTTEIDKQITDVQNRMTTAQGDLAAAQTLASEPAPKKVIRPKNPRGKGKKSYSPADIERVLRQ